MKTMMCLILDRSGSMGGRETDVINGVNTLLEEQKKLPEEASIAFVRFDTEAVERFRPMGLLAECKPLDKTEYQPRGGTPLLDAVGKTIVDLDEDWKREQPDRAILVIVTDGEENASREYTKAKVKEMIESRQASGKWAIIYLGANVDAFHEAGSLGISAFNTAGYQNTARGTKAMYNATSASLMSMRSTGRMTADNLGGNIDEDGDVKKATPKQPTAAPSVPWQAPTGSPSSAVWSPPV